jgi:hypothetical protein
MQLEARCFVEIDIKRPESEVLRLESLQAQLAQEPPAAKRRLALDFLAITEDPGEKPASRAAACNMLGALCGYFGKIRSSLLVKRLKRVLSNEFIVSKQSGVFRFKEADYIRLREIKVDRFPLLMILLVTIARIDFGKNQKFIEAVVKEVRSDSWKNKIAELLAHVKSERPGTYF